MNKIPAPILLSDEAVARAEAQARDAGFDSLESYVTALIDDDRHAGVFRIG